MTDRPAAARTRPRQRRDLTVRTRIAMTMVALSTLALASAGTAAFVLQRASVDQRIEDALLQTVAEFETFHRDAVDPRTGARYATVADLVYNALQLTVPGRHEGMLGLVDDEVRWTAPASVELRLEDDPALVSAVVDSARSESVRIATVSTPAGTYRYTTIPVRSDTAAGAVVHAIDVTQEHAEFNQVFGSYARVAAGAVVVIAVVGWFLAGRSLRPLRVLRRTADLITDSDLSRRIPVTGNDDLAALTETINAMLDRLEAALTSQRRMLDDAGHELRTPLTIVRGHLELMRPDDHADAAETRALVLDEVLRMQRLVDDLMTLATANHPGFVRLEPTDVGHLTAGVHDKIRLLADRRWLVDAAAAVTADIDPQRITQAMLQLGANAVRHTAPGATIAIGSAVSQGSLLRFWVRDEGSGVAPEDAARIFDRFTRGAGSTRDDRGAGLGLAIVSAIAQAHGGRVLLDSVPGRGATFTLEIPALGLAPAPAP
ncbi:MAG: ATP-binding protein, partial [Cellulomonadaceae bacterium]